MAASSSNIPQDPVKDPNNHTFQQHTSKTSSSFYSSNDSRKEKPIQGVMQNYYEQKIFSSSREDTMRLSFVGTTIHLVVNLLIPLSRILEITMGIRFALVIASVFSVVGLTSASFCTEIWQLYLAIGLCLGASNSILNSVSQRLIPQWFEKKRGIASAIAFSGSVITGLVSPFIMTSINLSLGIVWTYRILAVLFIGVNVVIIVIIRENTIPSGEISLRDNIKTAINTSVLRDINFFIWVSSCIPQTLIQIIPFIFVPVYATYIGLSPIQGTTAVAVISGVNLVGRIFAGFMADKIGTMNTYIIYNTLSGSAAVFIWTFAYNYKTLLVFCVVYGFFGSVYFTLLGPTVARIVGLEKLPSGNIFIFLFTAPVAFGPSIASAVEVKSVLQPFLTYKLFLGIPLFISVIPILILKLRMTGTLLFAKI
ncbi:major facilitator superfamily domain-containing protein [Phascolomyces articulosus]|uniref:Major facilitator superfamily domain-containing protein n=1 Tax=Phascolomyces articulosus TaxID=60185 RepID=A0AAD5K2R6_9FUNG|nr:major facilitator superfamily domain-containing protein [Phascolomyces articulosus]